MLDRVYILTCRVGDHLILLPILYADFQAGLKVGLVVHKDYSGILDGVSYVTPIIFEGGKSDVLGALELAKRHSSDVVVCEVSGDTATLNSLGHEQRLTDSFEKEIFNLAGRLKDFQKNLPLVFDRRSPERELALIQNITPKSKIKSLLLHKYILVDAEGKSSPFPYKNLLLELIKKRFNNGRTSFKATIVDLSTIKAERFYDLLGLYEIAVCLVACDSGPLHLAQACPNLPVVALKNDHPTYWFGSAWRSNHICSIRYADFPNRAIEMLDAIQQIGKPGSIVKTNVKGHKLIHTYNTVLMNGEHSAAKETWEREYLSGRWIATPIEAGASGRDACNLLADKIRFPMLRDAIKMACVRAKLDDLIVLTRDNVCFEAGLTERLTNEHPWYARRRIKDPETFHPAYDLFAFTKQWWLKNHTEVPDLVFGKDRYWDRVLVEILKRNGGQELEQAVYYEPELNELNKKR